MPGLDCLSDEQVLPLLLAMDSETLLQVGKTSPRLYSLVCDRQVWRHLLKEVDLGKEQVGELAEFGLGLFGIGGSPGMMSEVLREAARRFVFLTGASVTIAIPSWDGGDDFEVFDVDAAYMEELFIVAETVGTKFKPYNSQSRQSRQSRCECKKCKGTPPSSQIVTVEPLFKQ